MIKIDLGWIAELILFTKCSARVLECELGDCWIKSKILRAPGTTICGLSWITDLVGINRYLMICLAILCDIIINNSNVVSNTLIFRKDLSLINFLIHWPFHKWHVDSLPMVCVYSWKYLSNLLNCSLHHLICFIKGFFVVIHIFQSGGSALVTFNFRLNRWTVL